MKGKKIDSKKLAILGVNNVMIFHDNADYNNLYRNTVELIKTLGYDTEAAKKGAELIKKIYIQYDKAQKYFELNNKDEEQLHYCIAHKLAYKLNYTLNLDYDISLLVDMVYYWRHKKKIKAIITIFRDWLQKLGWRKLLQTFYCTYYQVRAGYSHDKRDEKSFEKYLINLWDMIISSNEKNKLPILF
jgi:hypothetical protein